MVMVKNGLNGRVAAIQTIFDHYHAISCQFLENFLIIFSRNSWHPPVFKWLNNETFEGKVGALGASGKRLCVRFDDRAHSVRKDQ